MSRISCAHPARLKLRSHRSARLEEMQNRLNAMVQAVRALRPTLATFYASLSDEQKAQFNILGQNTGGGSGG